MSEPLTERLTVDVLCNVAEAVNIGLWNSARRYIIEAITEPAGTPSPILAELTARAEQAENERDELKAQLKREGNEYLDAMHDVTAKHIMELAALRAERDHLTAALSAITTAYANYRGKGVMPAPSEYRAVVMAIRAAERHAPPQPLLTPTDALARALQAYDECQTAPQSPTLQEPHERSRLAFRDALTRAFVPEQKP